MPKVYIKIGKLDRIWAYFLYNLSLVERMKLSKSINATPEKKCWLFPKTDGIPLNACKYLRIEPRASKSSFITGKANIYCNKWFLNISGKRKPGIKDDDIKNYRLHLAENKQSATSTLNQALKFYYGSMLKKKFVDESRRLRKANKQPVMISKDEVTKILFSVENIKHNKLTKEGKNMREILYAKGTVRGWYNRIRFVYTTNLEGHLYLFRIGISYVQLFWCL
jgi:hypothetical protein